MTVLRSPHLSATTGLHKPWMPAAAPLMTRWAKDVNPSKARAEYPRPQCVRQQWKSLNGLWQFALDENGELDRQILVPFTFESALSGLGLGDEVHEHVRYARKFTIPRLWDGQRIMLNFGAVDWECRVFVNGREVGSHRGGYTPFSFDITDALLPQEEQELTVEVFDPAAHDPHSHGMEKRDQTAFQPMGKQLGSVGIWYTRCTGIWQTVWLEPVSEAHIEDIRFDCNPSSGKVRIWVGANRTEGLSVTARVFKNGLAVAKAFGDASTGWIELEIDQPMLWTPETPDLYDVTITLKRGRLNLDQVRSYFAFRTISIEKGRITLNGKPYLLRAVLDQGYWPDGIYTAPTEEALLNDVLVAKAMGFNTARKHAKIEEARWYYLCDKHGLLVAQDMPTSQDLATSEAKHNYREEWAEVVRYLQNHPCVALWIPFNENWGEPGEFQDEIVDFTRELDTSRPIIDSSGWIQRQKTDIIDHHDYTNDLLKLVDPTPEKPHWIGEYGGIAYPLEGHTWKKWWGYQSVKTQKRFLEKVRFLTRQITDSTGFSGFCYTQLADVEQELNGLLTYDRLPKAPPEKLAEIFNP